MRNPAPLAHVCATAPTASPCKPTVAVMKSFNRVATCLLVTGLSACVFAGPGYDGRGARQAEARGDHGNGRYHEGDRGCDSEYQRERCQDAEHR